MYIWGSGKDGRLGNQSEKNEKFPKKLGNFKYKLLACGYHHTAAVGEDGIQVIIISNK